MKQNTTKHSINQTSTNADERMPERVLKFMWYFICKQPYKLSMLVVISTIWALNESFFPYFIKRIVNIVSQAPNGRAHVLPQVLPFILALLAVFTLMGLTQRLQSIVAMYTIPKMKAQIRRKFYGYVQQHSHNYFMDNFAGDIANKVQALPASCERILETMIYSFVSMTTLLIFSFFMLWHANHLFAYIMTIWTICHFTIIYTMMQKGNALAEQHADTLSTLSGKIVDCISNIQNVRLFSHRHYEKSYLNTYQADEITKAQKFGWHAVRMGLALTLLSIIFLSSMLFGLINQWEHYQISLGDFSLVSMLMLTLLGMMWFMSFELTRLARECGTVRSALQLINIPHSIKDIPHAKDIKIDQGEIKFNKIDFNYSDDIVIFNKLNVTIKAGEKVGLVGFSGSGKTTFVNLIMRFYDLNDGEILIDGQNIAQVRQESLRQNISMIPQDPSLFHRSLMQNIRYGNVDASDDEVIAAAKNAHCDEFVSQLKLGYDTLVGERGIKLSGGQRQRIAIARGILKDAPILILDEATSSLDTVTERNIQSSLKQLMQHKTTLVVAHRLSTLTHMDRILVFKQGCIVEDGDIKTLLDQKGHFHKLWHMQQDGLLPDKA